MIFQYEPVIGRVADLLHSRHSRKRSSQRAINNNIIKIVINNGYCFTKQGLFFYTMKKKQMGRYPAKLKSKLINVVVVVNEDRKQIITVYKAKNAIKHLTRKQKNLA